MWRVRRSTSGWKSRLLSREERGAWFFGKCKIFSLPRRYYEGFRTNSDSLELDSAFKTRMQWVMLKSSGGKIEVQHPLLPLLVPLSPRSGFELRQMVCATNVQKLCLGNYSSPVGEEILLWKVVSESWLVAQGSDLAGDERGSYLTEDNTIYLG